MSTNPTEAESYANGPNDSNGTISDATTLKVLTISLFDISCYSSISNPIMFAVDNYRIGYHGRRYPQRR